MDYVNATKRFVAYCMLCKNIYLLNYNSFKITSHEIHLQFEVYIVKFVKRILFLSSNDQQPDQSFGLWQVAGTEHFSSKSLICTCDWM